MEGTHDQISLLTLLNQPTVSFSDKLSDQEKDDSTGKAAFESVKGMNKPADSLRFIFR